MFIKRHIEAAMSKISKMFGAVLLTGARQVGKTTFLKNWTDGQIPYITLDDPTVLAGARLESGTFFKDNPPPLVIDEIQYAPELFPHIKMQVDGSGKKGQIFLSGSQQFVMMKNVSESLAGRVGVLNLLGLSLREIMDVDFREPFIPTMEYLAKRKDCAKNIEYKDVWEAVHRGSMPEMWGREGMDWQMFYAAYTKTYIERDVRGLTQVGDEMKFLRFMVVAASMTGQLLNVASLARDVGISAPTAERWVSILRASNIIYLLQPFYNNLTKRAIKTPKLYFLDTGLAAYLTRWNTPEVLQHGAMAGNFFESFAVAEVIKSYYNAGILEPPLYFYRDKEKTEIDLLIQNGNVLHPVEIKKHSDPKKDNFSKFAALDKISGIERGSGGLVCMYDRVARFDENEIIIPINMI